jgi:hypothetical protein
LSGLVRDRYSVLTLSTVLSALDRPHLLGVNTRVYDLRTGDIDFNTEELGRETF